MRLIVPLTTTSTTAHNVANWTQITADRVQLGRLCAVVDVRSVVEEIGAKLTIAIYLAIACG